MPVIKLKHFSLLVLKNLLKSEFTTILTASTLLLPRVLKTRFFITMAGWGGFEPPKRFRLHAFQACAFSHSATDPFHTTGLAPVDQPSAILINSTNLICYFSILSTYRAIISTSKFTLSSLLVLRSVVFWMVWGIMLMLIRQPLSLSVTLFTVRLIPFTVIEPL